MKKRTFYILPLVSVMILSSCNQDQINQLNSEKQALVEESAEKEEAIEQMLMKFNQIQENLDEIKKREGILHVSDPEIARETMVEDIQLINQLMIENEELNRQLLEELSESNYATAELRKMVDHLNEQMDEKDKEIALLKQEIQLKDKKLFELFISNDSLSNLAANQKAEINEMTDEMNIAFYAYGTYKDLEENKVLTKEGGVLGLGKTTNLEKNLNVDYFTKIDIRKQKSFLIYADKAELVSKHPDGSYKFVGENKVDSLVITDVDAFWKTTKMMVIVID